MGHPNSITIMKTQRGYIHTSASIHNLPHLIVLKNVSTNGAICMLFFSMNMK